MWRNTKTRPHFTFQKPTFRLRSCMHTHLSEQSLLSNLRSNHMVAQACCKEVFFPLFKASSEMTESTKPIYIYTRIFMCPFGESSWDSGYNISVHTEMVWWFVKKKLNHWFHHAHSCLRNMCRTQFLYVHRDHVFFKTTVSHIESLQIATQKDKTCRRKQDRPLLCHWLLHMLPRQPMQYGCLCL